MVDHLRILTLEQTVELSPLNVEMSKLKLER